MPADRDPTASRPWRLRALALAATGPLVGALLWLRAPLAAAAAVQLASAFAAWRLWRRSGPGGREMGLIAATLVGCFPVVGSLGAWWLYGRPVHRAQDLVDAYRAYIGRNWETPNDLAPLNDPERALAREVAVLPLGDQLGSADLAGKQSAAAALQRMDGDAGVRVLRQALTHPADDTRLMASLALLKKEEALVSALKDARTRVQTHPDPQAHLALSAVARRYAESGLSAGGVRAALWRECAHHAEAACQAPDTAPAAWGHLAAARLALGETAAAVEAAEQAIALAPGDEAAHLVRLEGLFALGRRAELLTAAEALSAVAVPGGDASAQASFWCGHAR